MSGSTGSRSQAAPQEERPVTVFANDLEGVPQPGTFKFCPLGAQLYVRQQVDECSLLELELQLPPDGRGAEHISCSGIVAHCCSTDSGDLYRVWVKFLDLPATARDRIGCLAKSSEFLCPFCENF